MSHARRAIRAARLADDMPRTIYAAHQDEHLDLRCWRVTAFGGSTRYIRFDHVRALVKRVQEDDDPTAWGELESLLNLGDRP